MSLLHVRGGVSVAGNVRFRFAWSSPRPWRCFLFVVSSVSFSLVFSTSVEVFPHVATRLTSW